MLDFSELPSDGTAFEQMVRELAFSLGYRTTWSGVGPDGGQDLLVDEEGDFLFGAKGRRWLVSCKHTAHAKGGRGRPVGVSDLDAAGGIKDACEHHGAQGFLLVCSTFPSAAVVTRLTQLGASGKPHTHIWDGVLLERMLQGPRQWAIAQRFLPVSAGAAGWQIWATEQPNHFIGAARGFYFHLYNRHGRIAPYQLSDVLERLDALASVSLPRGHELRLRAMFHDDKHGWSTWYVDYLYDRRPSWNNPSPTGPVYTAEALAHTLGDGGASYSDGQIDSFDVALCPVDRDHDAYDPDHYDFYDPHRAAFATGFRRGDA
jgi:hypothetical protein